MQVLKRVDIFPKFNQDFEKEARDRTLLGGLLSALSIICISLLVFSEIRFFFTTQKHHEIFVDGNSVAEPLSDRPKSTGFFSSAPSRDPNSLQIKLNITFFEVPCDLMSVDAIDSFGEYVSGMERATVKRAVSRATGAVSSEASEHLTHIGVGTKPENQVPDAPADRKNEKRPGCWSCYGAELAPDDCCNTCESVREAYTRKGWSFSPSDMSITQCAKERLRRAMSLRNHEGCSIVVDATVSRVQGNLHLIPGRAFSQLGQHVHDLAGDDVKNLNLTHRIESMSFGDPFPGIKSPLDGVVGRSSDAVVQSDDFGAQKEKEQEQKDKPAEHAFGGGKFSYYIKVVPTQWVAVSGEEIETNEYAVTSHHSGSTVGPGGQMTSAAQIPGLFFQYDIVPLVSRVTETRPYSSFVHLLLQLCSIAGGVLTVASLVDAFVYHSAEKIRKVNLGKQT